jgi:hypothetical protein
MNTSELTHKVITSQIYKYVVETNSFETTSNTLSSDTVPDNDQVQQKQ